MNNPARLDSPLPEPSEIPAPAKHHRHGRHRTRHRNPGHRGKLAILAMGLLLFTYLGVTLYVSVTQRFHPLLKGWDSTMQWILHGMIALVSLLCLFRLYRGSPSVKHLMGVTAIIGTCVFALSLTLNLLTGPPQDIWISLDGFGILVGAFTTWTCLFSSSVSGFLNYQQDHTSGKL